MKTVLLGPPPPEVEALIARRQELGLDGFDEMWDGEYHMAPMTHSRHSYLDQVMAEVLGPYARRAGLVMTGPFNLGPHSKDFRVPDRGLHRGRPDAVWVPTAAMVVEILSSDDETFEKLPFYAAHDVDEVLIVDPASNRVRVMVRQGDGYGEAEASALLGVTVAELTEVVDWPDDSD